VLGQEQFIGGMGFSNPVAADRPPARAGCKTVSWLGFEASPVQIAYGDLVWVERLTARRGLRFHTQTMEERGRHWDRRNGTTFFWLPGHSRHLSAALARHGVEIT
jgi:hypothetical protein